MESNSNDCAEPSVDEGAFWHTKMDLYYGYLPGEVVEVEHEPNKYWLALIQYCFKQLVLLKWVGNYGDEFWIDTSMTSTATSSSGILNEFNNPKRLFPLGYHLQSQLKSQFTLEKPSRILVKPSLYNPSNDPYADIQTIDDLLVHEINDQSNDDSFAIKSTCETASLALAKCKTKINYGQEDQDELEAALQSLTGLEQYDESTTRPETLNGDQAEKPSGLTETNRPIDATKSQIPKDRPSDEQDLSTTRDKPSSMTSSELTNGMVKNETSDKAGVAKVSTTDRRSSIDSGDSSDSNDASDLNLWKNLKHDPDRLELCKKLQASAIKDGRYRGIHPTSNKYVDEFFYCKPKQFFDVGGANQERLFVPGTLLEVRHIEEDESGNLNLHYWFAFVVRNVGGRLTLRWFLSDEPKFKQGRLEMKSSRSKLVSEEPNQLIDGDNSCDSDTNKVIGNLGLPPSSSVKSSGISSKSITFSMHFCDPRIHTIEDPDTDTGRDVNYKLPLVISAHIIETYGEDFLDNIISTLMECVFDKRRMNLDKDRPLIDHILETVRYCAPRYLDLVFAPSDNYSKREVLMSCPKLTKLLRATIKRELEPGVFEIHSEPSSETGEIFKIVYPCESSYAILPIEWASNHKDCLSVNASRNPSPTIPVETSHEASKSEGQSEGVSGQQSSIKTEINENMSDPRQVCDVKSDVAETFFRPDCLREARSKFMRSGGSFNVVKQEKNLCVKETQAIRDFDEYDPKCWAELLRNREEKAQSFHCCIDLNQKEDIERRFKVMDQLEVVHPSSDSIICLGRIRKVVFPLIWIQLSTDCFTLVPFNSTNIYPSGWCEAHSHKRISLLPPRKRSNPKTPSQQSNDAKRRKKAKITYDCGDCEDDNGKLSNIYENEHFDLGALKDRQADIDYILNEKSAYIKIFFNHKCFTGPSLSKSKICSLPQHVGPGPMRLVVEEVVTKIISVAYVPPRILNDLSSSSFEELLIERNLTNTVPVEFKAKYQKRVHRDTIPVCVNPDDVAHYCECICEHIKCCYNLFGLNLYDGDDCPSHCRSLTKSNKFMKRATYYREKARQGEFLNQNNIENVSSKKVSNSTNTDNNSSSRAPSRARYTGRGSSESTSSSNLSCSDQTNSRASPMVQGTTCEAKENSVSPDHWTVDDVARYLDGYQLSIFKSYMKSEGIDGQAFLLLDKATIEEHFQQQIKSEITQEEVNKLCQLVELIKARV